MREKDFVYFWEREGWPDLCLPSNRGEFTCN
jgi:hypothetical protein